MDEGQRAVLLPEELLREIEEELKPGERVEDYIRHAVYQAIALSENRHEETDEALSLEDVGVLQPAFRIHTRQFRKNVRFYVQLGFQMVNYEAPPPSFGWAWAMLYSRGCRLSIWKSSRPIDVEMENFEIFLTSRVDVALLYRSLQETGLRPQLVSRDFETTKLQLKDPDGRTITISNERLSPSDAMELGEA